MSAIFYMASDYPLKERPNPNCKTLSVNEALAMGMDVPGFLLEPGFDRDKPDVLLWSDDLDTQGKLDEDFSIHVLDASADDIYTEKKYRAVLEWDCTEGRAEKVIQYIREHLEHTDELELWHVWVGLDASPKIRRCPIPLDELRLDDLKELSDLEVWKEPVTHYCFAIKAPCLHGADTGDNGPAAQT